MKKFFYWLSSFTWGILGTIIGFFVWIFFKCMKKPTKVWKGSFCTDTQGFTKSGCFSIGIFTFVDGYDDSINNHEFGHCIQNAMWGPLVFFVVNIPSMVNYWYCEIINDFSSHDKMWCERNATALGKKDW